MEDDTEGVDPISWRAEERIRSQLAEVTLLHLHLRQLHVGINVIRFILDDLVQSIPISLLQDFEEAQLSRSILPAVIEGVPFPVAVSCCMCFGTVVRRELEHAG